MFQHFILTEFSYRSEVYSNLTNNDPLKPKFLEHRFKLFEISCLPSILSQTEQNFTWILIIDKELPKKFRHKLEKLISVRPNSYLQEFSSLKDLSQLLWLEKYIDEASKYIITTKLDDDDAIYPSHTKYIKNHLTDLLLNGELPPVYFFGCYNVILWDFFFSEKAHLGYAKPRPKTKFPPSTGYTLCCKYPEMDFSILSFAHDNYHLLADDSTYFNDLQQTKKNQILRLRHMIRNYASKSNLGWDGVLLKKSNFHNFKTNAPQAIVMNHFLIGQYSRLLNSVNKRLPVDSNSFKDIAINFNIATIYIKKFRISIGTIFKILQTTLKLNPPQYKQSNFLGRLKMKTVFMKKVVIGIKKLR